jgi:4a-hydroxytetrahydrobiopterin dehydratase
MMDNAALQQQIDQLEGWTYEGGMLRKTYSFGDFVEAVSWTIRVAFLAEAHEHHPDIDIRYNRVSLALVTHDAGNQVTEKDINLARAVEQITK